MSAPLSLRFPDGRLHLQHGPIDCIVEAWGAAEEVEAAYAQSVRRFESVLTVLVSELPLLRQPVRAAYPLARGPVAKRMIAAAWPHRKMFITPMAAVAGAVADELMASLVAGRELHKAYVNDGGDIALHLSGNSEFAIGILDDPSIPVLDGGLKVKASDCVRGIATSGWRGRSQSLGIADAVTVLSADAASADAAATLIANAVNVEHPAIDRLPARAVKEDSDLGDLPVTIAVGSLPRQAIEAALDAGLSAANELRHRGLIDATYLSLQGYRRVLGTAAQSEWRLQC